MPEKCNPGSHTLLQFDNRRDPPQFKRLFMTFKVFVDGFITRCRPFIGLDGCFLKHKIKGVIFKAVGIDANNEIFPTAYSLAENKSTSNWTWFLGGLIECVGFEHACMCTWMSNRQKVYMFFSHIFVSFMT